MASATVDRRLGLVGNTAIKAPVDCATTANITLSGEQTIDGVTTSTSRVLVKDQTNTVLNGIYNSSSSAWTRALDFNGNYDVTTGTLVGVAGGAQAQSFWQVTTAGTITIDTSAIAFATPVVPGSLTTQLASAASGSLGAGMIGYSASLTYGASTIGKYVHDRITEPGTRSLGIGLLALAAATTATDCVTVGPDTGTAITSGFGHTIMGSKAGKTLTTPAYCSLFGICAGEFANRTSDVNLCISAFGAYALSKNTDGQYNGAFGHKSQELTTTGYFNNTFGSVSAGKITTSHDITVFGHAGFGELTSGDYNVGIGSFAGMSATGVSRCTLGGFQAGANNLTGSDLTAWGYAAAASNTVGTVAAFGKQAAYSVNVNGGVAAFGNDAGINALGANWTAVGHESMGGTGANYGTSQTFLGYRSGYTNAAAYNNTSAIGANSANTRSNQIMLGDSSVTEVRTAGYVVQRLVATGSTTMDTNTEFAFYVVDNTHVNFKYKGSDGTVRAATGAFGGGGFVLA